MRRSSVAFDLMTHFSQPHRARVRFRAATFVLAALLAAVPTLQLATARDALAQPARAPSGKVVEELSGEAKAAFSSATLLYRAKQFAEAQAAYERAYELSRNPRILYNVAACMKEAGQFAGAIRLLKTSISTPGVELPADFVDRVSDTITLFTKYVSELDIQGSAPGMDIEVDGQRVTDSPVLVDAGEHRVKIAHPDYETFETTFTAVAGARSPIALNYREERKRVPVLVKCEQAGPCTVEVDDSAPVSSPALVKLVPGVHTVHVSADGRRSEAFRMQVNPRVRQEYAFASPQPKPARVRIVTDDEGDLVMIGREKYDARRGEVQLPPGEYRIAISRPGALTKVADLVLRENETRDLRFSLDKKPASAVPWIIGAVTLVAIAGGTAAYFAFRPVEYEGSSIGRLNPGIARANYGFTFSK